MVRKQSEYPCISIHALHEESDHCVSYSQTHWRFQSTLSMRRATRTSTFTHVGWRISIHALHEESDSVRSPSCRVLAFQSTLSMRRATVSCGTALATVTISIHALHEESDPVQHGRPERLHHISIHALHEESDRMTAAAQAPTSDFNPRSP